MILTRSDAYAIALILGGCGVMVASLARAIQWMVREEVARRLSIERRRESVRRDADPAGWPAMNPEA